MANKAKTNASNVVKWSKRSKDWRTELVSSSNNARDNSYMFIALIMLDKFGSMKETELVKLVSSKHVGWFGKFSNTASETTKENVHAFLTSKGFDSFDRSYYGKIWADVTKKAGMANLAAKSNGNVHATYQVEAIIEKIIDGKMVISITVAATSNPVLKQGDGNNGTSKSKYYKMKKDGSYVTAKGKTEPKEFPRPFPTDPANCKTSQDVTQCREHWNDMAKTAKENLAALTPMLKKGTNGRAKFTAFEIRA